MCLEYNGGNLWLIVNRMLINGNIMMSLKFHFYKYFPLHFYHRIIELKASWSGREKILTQLKQQIEARCCKEIFSILIIISFITFLFLDFFLRFYMEDNLAKYRNLINI